MGETRAYISFETKLHAPCLLLTWLTHERTSSKLGHIILLYSIANKRFNIVRCCTPLTRVSIAKLIATIDTPPESARNFRSCA